jgi:hypothetical protein
MQDYLQTTGVLVNTTNSSAGQVAAFQNAAGQSEAIVIDPDNNLFHACREPLSDSGWNIYGLGAGFAALAALDALTVWAVEPNGGTIWRGDHGRWTQTQTLPGGYGAAAVSVARDAAVWASDIGGNLFTRASPVTQNAPDLQATIPPVLIRDSEQNLNFLSIDQNGALVSIQQTTPGGGWGTWKSLGGPSNGVPLASIAAAPNQDGRLQAFALGTDGQLYTAWQVAPAGNWSSWGVLVPNNAPTASALAVGLNQDGRLQVFIAGPQGVWSAYQMAPDNAWSAWINFEWPSETTPTGITAVIASAGELHIAAFGLYVIQSSSQVGPNQGWGGWRTVGDPTAFALSQLTGARNADGHLELFGLGTDGIPRHIWQSNGAWQGWQTLDPVISGAEFMTVGQNVDGRLEVFVCAGGEFQHLWQTSPSNGWATGWLSLGAPSGEACVTAAVTCEGGQLELFAVTTAQTPWLICQSMVQGTSWPTWITNWWSWYPMADAPELAAPPAGSTGDFWAITKSGSVMRRKADRWTSFELPGASPAACITADDNGNVWVLGGDPNGTLFQGGPAGFEQLPGSLPGATALGGSGAALWALAKTLDGPYLLWQYDGRTWQPAPAPPLGSDNWFVTPSLTVGLDDTVWLLDHSGCLWIKPQPAQTGSLKSHAASLVAIGAAHPNPIPTLAAQPHSAWGVTTDGSFRRSVGAGWIDAYAGLPSGATATQVSVGLDGAAWALDQDGVLYTRQGWDQPPHPADGATAPVIATRTDGSGSLWLLAVDASGQFWASAERKGAKTWGNWTAIASPEPLTNVVTGQDQDGTLEAFCIGDDHRAYHAWRDEAASSGWSGFELLGASGQPSGMWLAALETGRGADDRLFAFAADQAGGVWWIEQNRSSATGWSGWWQFPELQSGASTWLAEGNDPGGELEVFALDRNGVVHHAWQEPQAASGWSDWDVLGDTGQPAGVALVSIATGNRPDGTLYLVAVGADRAMYAINGDPASTTGWSQWISLGAIAGVQVLRLQIGGAADGSLVLVAQGSDGAAYNAVLPPGANAEWNGWSPMGAVGTEGAPLYGLALGTDDNGALRAFAAGDGSVWQTRQVSGAVTGWGDWVRLSGAQSWQACSAQQLAQAPLGPSTDLWSLAPDGTLLRSVNGGADWTTIAFPGSGILGVTVGIDGYVWAATATACYAYADGQWQLTASQAFAAAPVGAFNDLWAIAPGGALQRSCDGGGTWSNVAFFTGQAQQLTACGDGSVWVLNADGSAELIPAWQRIMQPSGMAGYPDVNASQVVAGHDSDGMRWLFLRNSLNNGWFCMGEVGEHAWSRPSDLLSPDDSAQIQNIGLAYQQDTGALIAYGLARDGALWVAQRDATTASGFAVSNVQMLKPLTADSLAMIALDAERRYWFAISKGQLSAGAQNAGQVDMAVVAGALNTANNLVSVLPLPASHSDEVSCFVVAANGQVYLVSMPPDSVGSTSPAVTWCMTDASTPMSEGVTLSAAVLQANIWAPPQLRLYAIGGPVAANGAPALWMRCRIDLTASIADPQAWSPWIPIGGSFPGVANGPARERTDTLFVIDESDSLSGVFQDPATGIWRTSLIKRPSQAQADIESVATYQTEITVMRGATAPAPDAVVSITADAPVAAWIEDRLYALDPKHAITVRPNALGKLTVRTLAEGLHTPQLSFQAQSASQAPGDAGTIVQVEPSQNVYAFLQGTGQLPVGGGVPAKLTAETLAGATVNGKPLNGALTLSTVAPIVKNITAIAAMPGGPSTGRYAPSVLAHHAGIEHFEFHHAPEGLFSSIWYDVKHAAESIAHAVEHGIVQAEVTIEHDAVQLALSIGGEIAGTVTLVIHTAEDALRAIAMYAEDAIAAIKEVIEWLKLRFDWDQWKQTQDKIRLVLANALQWLLAELSKAEQLAPEYIAKLKEKFQQAMAQFDKGNQGSPYQKFGDLPQQVISETGEILIDAERIYNAVSGNWLLKKIISKLTSDLPQLSIPGLDPTDFLQALNLKKTIEDLETVGKELIVFMKDVFSDPGQFLQLGITAFLQAAQDMIMFFLDLVDGVIEALLLLAKDVISGTWNALQEKIHIPFIGDLFASVIGEELTFLNVASLLVAIPAYMVSMTLFDEAPFAAADLTAAPTLAAAADNPAVAWAKAEVVFSAADTAIILGWDTLNCIGGLTELQESRITSVYALCDMLSNVVMQIGGTPWGVPKARGATAVSGTAEMLVYEEAVLLNWGVYWLYPLVDVFTCLQQYSKTANIIFDVAISDEDTCYIFQTFIAGMAWVSGTIAGLFGALVGQLTTIDVLGYNIAPAAAMLYWTMIPEVSALIEAATDETVDPAAVVALADLVVDGACTVLAYLAINEAASGDTGGAHHR